MNMTILNIVMSVLMINGVGDGSGWNDDYETGEPDELLGGWTLGLSN
jgi:hypothetical protein